MAVRAGYSIVAVDAYLDAQTLAMADKAVKVGYGELGFDAGSLLTRLDELSQEGFMADGFVGCMFGAGFEAQPELLQKIAERFPILGNSPEVVARVKDAEDFFDTLEHLGVAYPRVTRVLDEDECNYIRKRSDGCGGMHISFVGHAKEQLSGREYYQQLMDGRPVSVLFVANGLEISVIGYNEQWLSPSEQFPFRYGGAVSGIHLEKSVEEQLILAARKLTSAYGLRGLNSMDALICKDKIFVLEINPRLSATAILHEDHTFNLIEMHLQTCRGQLDAKVSSLPKKNKAHAVVYAPCDLVLDSTLDWPEWLVDTPPVSEGQIKILAGEPVCTVLSSADSAQVAMHMVKKRVGVVLDQFTVASEVW